MFRTPWTYFSQCFIRALRGSLSSALNWAGIVGVGVVGGIYEYRGLTMTDPHSWQEVVKWGLIYTGVAWIIIFTIRLIFVAPFQMFAEATEKVAPLKLREIEAQEAHARALRRQADAIERQSHENDPWVKWIREKQTASLQPRVLKLEVGEGPAFFSTEARGEHGTKRTYKIKLSNVHNHQTTTNCKVIVTKVEPQDEYVGPWTLKEFSAIAAGEHDFIPLASYGEARRPDEYNCADSFFTTYLGNPGHPGFDIRKEYIFTIRATGTHSPLEEIRCKLWVDEKGRFRIEQV